MAFSQLLLGVLVLLSVCSAWAAICPNMDCGLGRVYDGYFMDQDDPVQPSSDYLKMFMFNPNTMDQLYPGLQDPDLKDPEGDCYKLCELFNANLTKPTAAELAAYWLFELTCDTDGGNCYCYNAKVCDYGAGSYNLDGHRKGDYQNYVFAANFTAGKLCPGKNKGDPHFTGGDGSHYDFSGVPNRNYAIISDSHLQINGFFGGRYSQWGAGIKALTWIRSVGIMYGHHTLLLEARKGASAEYEEGYMGRIVVDGNEVEVASPGTNVALWEGASMRWVAARERSGSDLVDVYEVTVSDVVLLRLTLRPEVAKLRTHEDGAVHFGLDILRSTFSPAVHGVLGQTYRPTFAGRLQQQRLVWSELLNTLVVPGDNAEGFIDGAVDDYQVSALLAADCSYCRFTRSDTVDSETALAIDMAGGVIGGGGPAVPRKFLDVE